MAGEGRSQVPSKWGGNIVAGIGFLGLIASFAWWLLTYANVGAMPRGGGLEAALPCLVWSTLDCQLVKGFLQLGGYFPYEPTLLWLSGILLIVGFAMEGGQTEKPDDGLSKRRALVEVDPEIRAAAERVRKLGQDAELSLAKKFLVLGDKQYLAAIVGQLEAEGERRAGAVETMKKSGIELEQLIQTPIGLAAVFSNERAALLVGDGSVIVMGHLDLIARIGARDWQRSPEVNDQAEQARFLDVAAPYIVAKTS